MYLGVFGVFRCIWSTTGCIGLPEQVLFVLGKEREMVCRIPRYKIIICVSPDRLW